MEFNAGDVVGGYTVVSVLGSGGMGTVYRATNPTLPRSDALKILSAEFSRDDQFRARFQREADVAATLDHPNIVAVYTRGEFNGQLWIAMQYVPGSDADRELKAGTMTPLRAAYIVTEVAKALDYAHRRGIMHRDVKPANFLISPAEHDSDDERVFLADFGIARALDDAAHLTTDGTVMASVAYAAPEVLTGVGVDRRADIYSLGCSLFRMLTNKGPYSGLPGGLAAMAAAHMTAPPPRVTDLVPGLPPALDDVIARAMAKDPEQRYQSAREFADAATAAIADSTTAIPRSTLTQEWSTPLQSGVPQRPPPYTTPPTGVGTHSGPAAVTYPTGHFSGPHGQTMPRQFAPGPQGPLPAGSPPVGLPPVPKKSLKSRLVIAGTILLVIAVVAVGAVLLFNGSSRKTAYTAQTFTHVHGTTQVSEAPTAVAAVGPGDADAVLALGVQPVAIESSNTPLPSWLHDKITGSPAIMNFVDTNAIQAAKPDLIIATGDLDDATYQKLQAIAPTITRPSDTSQAWNWQTQLHWIAKILGRESDATQLISTVVAQQNDLKNQNSKAAGKTVSVLNVSDSGVTQTLTPSNAADYLTSLGLSYSNKLQRQPDDQGVTRAVTDLNKLYLIDSDVLVVVRTDKVAGGGGASGLPSQLAAYRGVMVIVDDPDTIAAFAEPGGVLAYQFLDSHFVPNLASSIP
jgi:serine/threonine protein kinase